MGIGSLKSSPLPPGEVHPLDRCKPYPYDQSPYVGAKISTCGLPVSGLPPVSENSNGHPMDHTKGRLIIALVLISQDINSNFSRARNLLRYKEVANMGFVL